MNRTRLLLVHSTMRDKNFKTFIIPFIFFTTIVDKDDGSKRFVVDYRELNKDIIPDTYPLSSVNEMLEQSFGCRFFSQLDLASGYWAIPITEADRCKTAFRIPTRKLLQRFLGLANYNRRFIERYSDLCKPLNKLTSSKVPFVWTSVEQRAFEAIRDKFHETLSLHLPDWNRDLLSRRMLQRLQ